MLIADASILWRLRLTGQVAAQPAGPRPPRRALDLKDYPLVDAVAQIDPGRSLASEIHFDPVGDPFLAQHVLKQRPVTPLAVSLEAMAEAAAILGEGKHVVGLRDVAAVKALRFYLDQILKARVGALRREDRVECRLTCDFRNRRGQLVQADQLHASAVVEVAESPPRLALPAPGLPPSEAQEVPFGDRDTPLRTGPALHWLRKIRLDLAGGWGEMIAALPQELGGERRAGRWLLPAAGLDACFVACGVYLWYHHKGVFSLPHAIGRLRLGRLPQAEEPCVVRLAFRGWKAGLAAPRCAVQFYAVRSGWFRHPRRRRLRCHAGIRRRALKSAAGVASRSVFLLSHPKRRP